MAPFFVTRVFPLMTSPPLVLIAVCLGLVSLGLVRDLGAQENLAVFDSARAELDRGRAWHAARLLRAQPDLADFGPDRVLLLARAEAGWRGFQGVANTLRGRSWLAEVNRGEGLYLLGLAEAKLGDLAEDFKIDHDRMWRRTVYPATPAENWFVSASAGYWKLLEGLDEEDEQVAKKSWRKQ